MRRKRHTRGAALVVTLIVMVVLAVVAVAFMQNTGIDRLSARSAANAYRAKLAAEAGLAEVMARIAAGTANDDFIVLKNEADAGGVAFPVFYLGVPQQVSVDYTPLVSGGIRQPDVPADVMPNPGQIFADGARLDETLAVPGHVTAGGERPVRAAWVEITNAAGLPIARYSFWAEDLGGYLDADLAGAKPLQREEGKSPEELGLFTLFRPQEQRDSNPQDGADRKLVEARANKPPGMNSMFLTLPTLGLLGLGDGLSSEGEYNASEDFQQYFATGLRYPDERATVPRGFNYVRAGQPKKDLNAIAQRGGDSAVNEIAGWIQENLPDFQQRKGGFPDSQDYTKTLAANMIDYVDEDSDPTAGQDYRGVDSYPFLTQFFTQITWVNHEGGDEKPYFPAGGTWKTKVRVNYHLQLWNPSNQPVEEGILTVDLQQDGAHRGENLALFFDGSEVEPFYPFPGGEVLSAPVALAPNAYTAISFGPIEYEVDTGLSADFPEPSSGHSGLARFRFGTSGKGALESSDEHGYKIRWNNQVIDQPGAVTHGLTSLFEKNAGRHYKFPSTGGQGPAWRGGQPGLRHGFEAGVFASQQSLPLLGDPRGSFYIAKEIGADRYDQNASWWGRHYIAPESTSGVKNWFVSEARYASWPDGGHHGSGDRAFSLALVTPLGDGNPALRAKRNFVPADVEAGDRAPHEPDKAPARISNQGQFRSLTELGNVYDPIQWKPRWDAGAETTETAERKWQELGSDPNRPEDMIADRNYVVPTTLRIGRGEFAALDVPGRRAYQLLDLFTLEENVPTAGRININTASRAVLRTLGAGISLSADPAIEPASLRGENQLFGPSLEEQADLLADAIIRSRPFLTTSQLSNIRTDEGGAERYFFGNKEVWKQGGPQRWLDVAAEEYFAKLYELISVRSRNFRVFVTGDALDQSGRVLSRSRWVFQVVAEPQRDGNGAVTRQNILVTSGKSL